MIQNLFQVEETEPTVVFEKETGNTRADNEY